MSLFWSGLFFLYLHMKGDFIKPTVFLFMLSVSCIKTENIIKLQRGSSKLKTALPSHDMHDELNAFRHRFLCILNQHIFF